MKIYSIEKKPVVKTTNLGGKIKLDKLNKLLNSGASILVRKIIDCQQEDFRIKIYYLDPKKSRKNYSLVVEMGKLGFDEVIPRKCMTDERFKFGNLNDLLDGVAKNFGLKKEDWVSE